MSGGRGLGPNYRKLWSASAISNLGDGVRLTALPLLAASITRDPFLVSGVFAASFLPWLLLSLVSGALVDRWNRRVVMVWANVFRAAIIGLLGLAALAEVATLPVVYGVAFLLGTAETLFDNAAQSLMPQVVARDDLETANGRMYAAEIVTNQFLGPPVGGLLFAVAIGLPFLLNATTFAVSAGLVLAMSGVARPSSTQARQRLTREIGEGLRWLWRHRLLRTLGGMVGMLNLMAMAWGGVFVLFALEILDLSSVGFGILLSAQAVGSVLGALLGKRVALLLGSGTTLFLSVLLFGLSSLVVAATSDPVLVGAMFAVAGCVGMVWNVITVSLRQSIVPEHILGRVNSVYRLLAYGPIPVGSALGGALAAAFGLRAPFYAGGAVLVAMAVATLPFVNDRTIAAAREEPAERPEGAI